MAEEAPAAAVPAKAKGSSQRKRSSSARRDKGQTISKQILEILAESKQRKATSTYAIKKALRGRGVDVDVVKRNLHINLAIRRLVKNDEIVQVRGFGASGSFRLPKKDTKKETRKSKSKTVRTKSPARKSADKKVKEKKGGTPKKDKKKTKKEDKKKAKKTAVRRLVAKKPAPKRGAKPSKRRSGKVSPKKQKRPAQKKATQRRIKTSISKTTRKGKK